MYLKDIYEQHYNNLNDVHINSKKTSSTSMIFIFLDFPINLYINNFKSLGVFKLTVNHVDLTRSLTLLNGYTSTQMIYCKACN